MFCVACADYFVNNDMVMRLNNFQVAKKLATCEADLEKAEDRAEVICRSLMIVVSIKRGSPSSITIAIFLRWERQRSWSWRKN